MTFITIQFIIYYFLLRIYIRDQQETTQCYFNYHHWPLWRWCRCAVHGYSRQRRIRWLEPGRRRRSNIYVGKLEAGSLKAPPQPWWTGMEGKRERDGQEGWNSTRKKLKSRVPYLHDNQSQCKNQQNAEFVQHKRGEDVETFSDKHTTSVKSRRAVF